MSSCDWFAADAALPCHWGFRPKTSQHSLFILCFFGYLFYDIPPRFTFSRPRSSFGHSLTIASLYIKLDGVITPSPSVGQLMQTMTASLRNLRHSGAGGRPRRNQLFCFFLNDHRISRRGCTRVCVGGGILSAGKDSSEQEQLIIQPPININADAGCVRAQYSTCLWATGCVYCD